jgi:pimeloyl-ACP methyl ester carboxylesterase
MTIKILSRMWLAAPVVTVAVLLCKTPAAEPVVPPKPLTEAERAGFLAELHPLQVRLAELRKAPNMSLDRLADAQIFVKAVIWALDFGPVADANSRGLVKFGLKRARERVDALAAGRQPWKEARGRIARGFISAVDGSAQPYCVIVPKAYDPAKPMRLHVVLHGSTPATGIGELLFLAAADGGDTNTASVPASPYIELSPMGRLGENSYRFEGETDVDEAIEAVCRDYNIDRSRIVLRGHSLGGVGTWQLGLKRPDRYVAIGPGAGPVDTVVFSNSPWEHFVRLAPLTPWQKTMLHLVDAIDYTANAGMVPVVAVMGDKDPYFGSHLLIEKEFAKEGIPFNGMVDHGAGHGITLAAFQEHINRLDELAIKGSDAFPKHIRFVTWTLKFSRCNWIEVLGLTEHYKRAKIDARIGSDGSITVAEPLNITRFAIYPPAVSGKGGSLTIAGVRIALPASESGVAHPVVIEKGNGSWIYRGELDSTTLTGKRPGLQGPIDDAFARPFVCVRGTGKAWNPAVGAWADANLKRFTDEWRRHYQGFLPVKDDTEVTEEDVRHSNLILFGDPGSNLWIGKVLSHLPVKWTRETLQLGAEKHSAKDHGAELIYPNPLPGAEGHYVVVNSGHTYHDAELRFSYMVFPRLGDWAIMKVGENPPTAPAPKVAETVVNSGFFDEGWGAPVSR